MRPVPYRTAARAFALAASSSRFLGGAFVSSECNKRCATSATPSTAAKNAASFVFDGFENPLIFLTNWSEAARTSSSVTGGSKLKRGRIFRHIRSGSTLRRDSVPAINTAKAIPSQPGSMHLGQYSITPGLIKNPLPRRGGRLVALLWKTVTKRAVERNYRRAFGAGLSLDTSPGLKPRPESCCPFGTKRRSEAYLHFRRYVTPLGRIRGRERSPSPSRPHSEIAQKISTINNSCIGPLTPSGVTGLSPSRAPVLAA